MLDCKDCVFFKERPYDPPLGACGIALPSWVFIPEKDLRVHPNEGCDLGKRKENDNE